METDKKHIEELWLRYAQNKVNFQELNELFDSLQDPALETEHSTWAEAATLQAAGELPPDHGLEEIIWQRLLIQVGGSENSSDEPARHLFRHRIHFLRTGWFRFAAAILVCFLIGAYWWTSTRKNATQKVAFANANIQPGGNGAVLTLANGDQVSLDTIHNGTIALQGGATASVVNGVLTYLRTGDRVVYNTLTTPKGRQFLLFLPDGTQVWLNAASSIKYPTVFAGHERNVEVTGEAYFEVAKNKAMPFRINVNSKVQVEVIGTQFNISAYENEKRINTTLIEGSVRVVSLPTSSVILKPHQQAQVNVTEQSKNGGIKVIDNSDIDKVLAWKNGLFNFRDVTLEELMRQLERWYDIEVVYEGAVPDVELTGKMSRGVTLNGLLNSLQHMGLKFRLEGRKLIILP